MDPQIIIYMFIVSHEFGACKNIDSLEVSKAKENWKIYMED